MKWRENPGVSLSSKVSTQILRCQTAQIWQDPKSKGVEFSRDAMTYPYQYPAITKLSQAIILIKQLNICVCNHCCDFGRIEIGHKMNIIWEVKDIR